MKVKYILLCLCLPLAAFSANKVANKINPLKGFSVSVPDTVIQGSSFSVIYTLEATHWQKALVSRGAGLKLNDKTSNIQEGRSYSRLTVVARFSTSRVGHITLPPISAEIDGQEFFSETKQIYVKPHPQYGEEMTLAHEWLQKKGADKDSLTLNFTVSVGDFFFFCDQRHKCFCLVAKKDTWDCAGEPVWAYSMESAMDEESLKKYIPYFFIYYNDLLASLKKSGLKAKQFAVGAEQVLPLLGELKWGQTAPYNSKLPIKDGGRVLVGCVPLAMAMIMKYHDWPKQGMSNVYFETEGRKFNFDCTEMKPQWEQYKNQYDKEETAECAELSKILGTLALMMSPTYKESSTSANLNHTKHIMCNNLGYSGRMTRKDKPLNDEAFWLLEQELESRRPCIVARNSHAFICDGYEDGFFHFNLGWRGHGNGYFRAVGGSAEEKLDTMFHNVIIHIEPQKSESKKEVTLKKANTLCELLSDEEKENLTSLKITGPIGSNDIRLIRAMAGAKGDSLYDSRNMGTLRKLNLADASIVSDETPYRTRKPETYWTNYSAKSIDKYFTSFSVSDVFNFEKMDMQQWSKFNKVFAKTARQEGMVYSRINDNTYIESSFCIKNVIGAQMFAGCSSLYIITLPLNTKRILSWAFKDCESLKTTGIPASAIDNGKHVFLNCLSLDRLYVPIRSNPNTPYTSPVFLGENQSIGFEVKAAR